MLSRNQYKKTDNLKIKVKNYQKGKISNNKNKYNILNLLNILLQSAVKLTWAWKTNLLNNIIEMYLVVVFCNGLVFCNDLVFRTQTENH